MNNLLLFSSQGKPLPPEPPDASVREQALDIRRSFIIQAPAGSGKTALLIQRFLKLLADDSVTRPEQVLAITFTNGATAELRDRVLQYLSRACARHQSSSYLPLELAASAADSEAPTGDEVEFDRLTLDLAGEVLARDAELGWQLLAHPNRLNIRTIDSICAEIARALPVLSGSGGRVAPVENAAPLYREAARRTLLQLGGGDPAFNRALRNLLLHRDGNLDDCEALLADMLELREQWGELVPLQRRELDDALLDADLLPRLERALEHAISSALARLDALFPSGLLGDLAALAGRLGHLPGANGDANPIACCAGMQDPPEPVAAHLAHWRALIHLLVKQDNQWRKDRGMHRGTLGFDYDRRDVDHLQLAAILDQLRGRDDLLNAVEEVRNLPDPRYPANQWQLAKSLFRVLSHALVELKLTFAERGQYDFAELGLLARSALSAGAGDLASALGARLQHLLVDEMQDTSTGQYRLLELLTASWDGHSQTVFLVGDPYQSIYLFRQARVERFVQAVATRRLGDLPLTPLALTANFRSQRTLVDQFNHDFGLVFPAGDAAGAPPFIHADATRPPSSSAAGRVWHAHPQPPSSASAPAPLAPTQAQRDAESIARIAAEWLARPLPPNHDGPWRIAVLVRSRNHLGEVIPALRRAAVPFRAVDIETLRDRQEVLDLAALTRTLLHPADRVAALAVLRAPWCGLPLADLHLLAAGDDPSQAQRSILSLLRQRAHLLASDPQQRVARLRHVLDAAEQLRARLTAAQLVERAWRSLGGDAPLTPAQLTNARRFFELLDDLQDAAGRIDPTQLEDRLTRLYAEPDPLPEHSGFVELLTIHKAKGRQWDLVFVPALDRDPARGPDRLLTWSVLDDLDDPAAAHIMLAPIAPRSEDVDALTTWLKRLHRDREHAEHKRLFYVACTRAREELHLFAAPAVTAQGISSGSSNSMLRAVWAAAESHFAAAPLPGRQATQASAAQSSQEADSTDEVDLKVIDPIDIQDKLKETDCNLIPPLYPIVRRLPIAFDPSARFRSAAGDPLPPQSSARIERTAFARPEGSLAARSLGNAVHAWLEILTSRTAAGASPASLLAEIASWTPRITALLRADGLAPAIVSRLARETRAALENLLRDPDGLWLLAPHPGAAAEFSLTSASGAGISTLRADRIFRAGPRPGSFGDTHLWIVDYKTAHSGGSIEQFHAAQRVAYAPQLQAYARILAPAESISLENVRLALYFPALRTPRRLLYWSPEEEPLSLAAVAQSELSAEN